MCFRLLAPMLLNNVLLGAEESSGSDVRVGGCRERALQGEPLAGFVTFNDPIPTLDAGGVAAELDDIGVTQTFGNRPAAPG